MVFHLIATRSDLDAYLAQSTRSTSKARRLNDNPQGHDKDEVADTYKDAEVESPYTHSGTEEDTVQTAQAVEVASTEAQAAEVARTTAQAAQVANTTAPQQAACFSSSSSVARQPPQPLSPATPFSSSPSAAQ